MSVKKIDDLFRQKLSGHTVAPGEQAWEKLQKKMKPTSKAPAIWMQVAAAVLLLVVAGWVLLVRETLDEKTLAEQSVKEQKEEPAEELKEVLIPVPPVADNPGTLAEKPREENPEPAKPKKKAVVPPQKLEVASADQKPAEFEMPAAMDELKKKEESYEVLPEKIDTKAMETSIATASEPNATPEVKITYIAGDDERFLEPVRELIASDKQKDKKSGFSKLLASARNITSGDILADIRNSKDDLFSGNLKLNKDEKVNNSK